MARTHAAEEHITYAVMSCNNRRGVSSGFLCVSAPPSLLRNCAVNTPLQQRTELSSGVGSCSRELELKESGVGSRELSSAKIIQKRWQRDSWQLQQRIERVSEVGSWQNN
jgi:hypothetical protein